MGRRAVLVSIHVYILFIGNWVVMFVCVLGGKFCNSAASGVYLCTNTPHNLSVCGTLFLDTTETNPLWLSGYSKCVKMGA